jgi:predicted nucleotidyltransferase
MRSIAEDVARLSASRRQRGCGTEEATEMSSQPESKRDGTGPPADPRLATVVDRLVEAYCPERIYLFGSSARGDAGPDSDYDLMVVVDDQTSAERRRSRLAYERLWGTGIAADVLVWTRSRFESRLHLPASLPATVVREGRLLYAA